MTNPVLQSHEPWTQMVIAISGSSGLIGSSLTQSLRAQGHEVRPIVRHSRRLPGEISWNPDTHTLNAADLSGVDAVIHLAGESIAQRWTADVKRRIRASRIDGTRLLAEAIASQSVTPAVMLSASAIGIYGDRGDETLDEGSAAGTDFLASICTEWEAAAAPAVAAGVRVATLRTGIVLSRSGGALSKLLTGFRLGAGGRLGTGRQWMSWIGLTDYIAAVEFLLRAPAIVGPVNLVAPNPVTNAEFTRVLAGVLGRPALFAIPEFAMRFAMGQMASATILASQRVRPRKLLENGFEFGKPTLESALRSELATQSVHSGDH